MFWREDRNEVFYIGKGKNNRRFDKISNRNKYFIRICQKTKTYSTVYKENLTEDEAFNLEKQLIAEYRKNNLAYANFHEGGRGGNVYKYDGEQRKLKMKKRCREASLGEKNPMYGKNWQDFATTEIIENHKINVSNGLKNRYKNPEAKKITSESSKEVWKRPGYKDKMKKLLSRRVYMYDKNRELVKTFVNVQEALSFLEVVGHTGLYKAIKENKEYKNHFWRRDEQKGVETIEKGKYSTE